jgi:heat shock protein beta-11
MKDYAREENGGSVVMASCTDERFPPEAMLDGKDSTFWMTSGMFPQEFVLALSKTVTVSKITTLSLNGE